MGKDMAVLNVLNKNAEQVSQIEMADAIFNVPVKPHLLHEVVSMQMAGRRKGSASVKHRSDIRGSRRKLFRQKGTGQARRGDIKSPLLRGGGVVFGPDPKSWAYRVPKKVRRLALKMALSDRLTDDDVIILDNFDLDQIKTRAFFDVLNNLKAPNVLIITDQLDNNLDRSSRNVPHTKVLKVEGLNVYDILKYKKIIILESAVKTIERRLGS